MTGAEKWELACNLARKLDELDQAAAKIAAERKAVKLDLATVLHDDGQMDLEEAQ